MIYKIIELIDYTGDGSTQVYNLSQNVPNNQSLLVTLNGVVQHPTTEGVSGSYESFQEQRNTPLQFTAAPVSGLIYKSDTLVLLEHQVVMYWFLWKNW